MIDPDFERQEFLSVLTTPDDEDDFFTEEQWLMREHQKQGDKKYWGPIRDQLIHNPHSPFSIERAAAIIGVSEAYVKKLICDKELSIDKEGLIPSDALFIYRRQFKDRKEAVLVEMLGDNPQSAETTYAYLSSLVERVDKKRSAALQAKLN